MTPELRSVIDRAYMLFKRYKAAKPLDACTACCMSEQQENALVSLSTKSIPAELLYDYNTAAKPDKLSPKEYRHFLPRYLELIAEKQFLSHSVELSFCRFDYFTRSDWNEDELALFEDYARELFRHYLASYPIDPIEQIDGPLIMLTKAYVGVEKILEQWKFHPSRASVLHLNDLLHKGEQFRWKFTFDEQGIGPRIEAWLKGTEFDNRFKGILEDMIMQPGELTEHIQGELSTTYRSLGF